MEWLGDRVLTISVVTGLRCCKRALDEDEQAFILMSHVPNRKGQPLLVDWQSPRGRAHPARRRFHWIPSRIRQSRRSEGRQLSNPGHRPGLDECTRLMQQACPRREGDARPYGPRTGGVLSPPTSDCKAAAGSRASPGPPDQQLELSLERQLET